MDAGLERYLPYFFCIISEAGHIKFPRESIRSNHSTRSTQPNTRKGHLKFFRSIMAAVKPVEIYVQIAFNSHSEWLREAG